MVLRIIMDHHEDQEKKAIETALAGDWPKAIELNLDLLKENRQDIGALNRLARAYWQINDFEAARKTYQKVISLERYNPIANKALDRLKAVGKTILGSKNKSINLREFFLKEPGKTRTVHLVNVAKASLLGQLNSAECLKMAPKKHRIAIVRENGDYLGILPDDLSHRLLILLKGGNHYEVCVKTVGQQGLEVFIRETFRSKKFKNSPSFVHPNG
jgi:tetratricopeptide (TPR) repeat protein